MLGKKWLNPEQKLNSVIQQMLLICNIKLHPPAPRLFFLPGYLIMKQQIIHRATSGLLYCLCKCVICRIQQFPCNKLLKKRYVIPRYNNLCAVKVKFVINFSLTLTFILILTFSEARPFSCQLKVEHLRF